MKINDEDSLISWEIEVISQISWEIEVISHP